MLDRSGPDRSGPDRSGVPIVFLHGWAGSALGTWAASGIPALLEARGRTCIVPDLPGHGVAARDHGASHDSSDYDDIIDQVQSGLPGGPIDLVGFSLGAKIALMIAARAPEKVARAVTVAVGDNIFAAEGAGAALGRLLAEGIEADTPERLSRMAVYALQSGGDPLAMAACLRRAWHAPTAETLAAIRARVMLILAGNDELVVSADRLRACLPTAVTHVLPGHDHLSVPYATDLKHLVAEFLT